MSLDLFASFDYFIFKDNALIILTPIAAMFIPILSISNFNAKIVYPLILLLTSQTSQSKSPLLKGAFAVYIMVFFPLLFLNIMGMNPFTFAPTSLPSIILILGFSLWGSSFFSSFSFSFSNQMASLMPTGTPSLLAPFLALIEMISMCVRPITLTFRLCANITAGHIILGLAASNSTSHTLILIAGFSWFEMAIATMHASIFVFLASLYTNDHV